MKSSVAHVAIRVTLGAIVLQLLMVIAFAWPSSRSEPRDLPIAVAGPQAAVVAQKLDQVRPDAFEVTRVADEAAAREAIAGRDVYGAIVTTPSGPKVLTASGASPAVAQMLGGLGAELAGAPAPPVQDVVAGSQDDPRGSGFATMALPLVMSSIAAGILLTFLVGSLAWRTGALLVFAASGGLLVTWLAQGWLGVLDGGYLAVAAAMGLVILAVSGTVVGMAAAVGRAGIGLASLTMLLLGNPLSAAPSAPELLPQPWGDLGQLLPPGAGATLLRSISFFDGEAVAMPVIVLAGWAVAGLLLVGVGALRARGAVAPAAERREPEMAT